MGGHWGTGRDYIGDCSDCGSEFWGADNHPNDLFDESGVLVWFCPPCTKAKERRRAREARRANLKAIKAVIKNKKAADKLALKKTKADAKAAARITKAREKAERKEAKIAAKMAAQLAAGKAMKTSKVKRMATVSPKAS